MVVAFRQRQGSKEIFARSKVRAIVWLMSFVSLVIDFRKWPRRFYKMAIK